MAQSRKSFFVSRTAKRLYMGFAACLFLFFLCNDLVLPWYVNSGGVDAMDDEMPDFQEVAETSVAVRSGAKSSATGARHVRLKGREFRIDRGTGATRTTGSPRGEPPPGMMTRLAGALRRFFGSD